MPFIPALPGATHALTNSIPSLFNGASALGTLATPHLQPFLPANSLRGGFPWGDDDVFNTNPYTQSPSTRMTRYYDWDVSRQTLSPDGYSKNMIVVNSQFPGPLIEANWGDTIEVTVRNNIKDPPEGTTIHWHGFLMHHTPFMDGTPGLVQCPIAPGDSFTYTFKAELFGTSWWHSHYSGQYADGVFGPIVIHGPNHVAYDIDLGLIVLTDYFHASYNDIVESILVPRTNQTPVYPISDNNLINGKTNLGCSPKAGTSFNCTGSEGLAKFQFTSGKVHKLRLINSGVDGAQQFSIDNHIMTVITNDFVSVQPYETKIVTLGVGQRTDVLVNATQPSNSTFWIRSNITCSRSLNPDAVAILYYDEVDTNSNILPTSQPWPNPHPGCDNDPLTLTVPAYPIPVTDPGPNSTYTITITIAQNSSGVYLWYMNNISFRSDYSYPTLLDAVAGNYSYLSDPQLNTLSLPGDASAYRIIVQNQSPSPHPIHLHGHNMYVLAVSNASTTWDGSVTRPSNPQRRDVQQVPANGYLVFQADADNPGAWGFHCHMAFHSGLGLFMEIVEGGEEKLQALQVPQEVQQGCEAWREFAQTGEAVIIDSGQ